MHSISSLGFMRSCHWKSNAYYAERGIEKMLSHLLIRLCRIDDGDRKIWIGKRGMHILELLMSNGK